LNIHLLTAISAYHHHKIDGHPVGQHQQVCALMTGIFNEKPPKPKYVYIWDVEQALTYIKSLPENNCLSDRELYLKLATLLFLTSASRCHEICYLDIRYMARASESYKFYFTKVT